MLSLRRCCVRGKTNNLSQLQRTWVLFYSAAGNKKKRAIHPAAVWDVFFTADMCKEGACVRVTAGFFFFYNLSFSKVNFPSCKKTNAITKNKKQNSPLPKGGHSTFMLSAKVGVNRPVRESREAKLILKLRFKEKFVNSKAAREVDEQRYD